MVNNFILNKFKEKPYLLRMGSKNIAKQLKCNIQDVIDTRSIYNKYKEKSNNTITSSIVNNMPHILILDIETTPMQAYVWRRWKENISLDQTISEWFCICWSAKWLYSDYIMYGVVTPEEIKNEDDSRIMKYLWDILNKADIVIAHNGDKFDIPKINSRFICNGLPPTKPYKIIDTLKVVRNRFGFSSNKLDALAGYFGIETKLDTNFNLWKKCIEGDKESLDYMAEYNRKDVEILEEVYLILRPWIKNHPNISNYVDNTTLHCSNCGSSDIKEVDGEFYYTAQNKYQLYRCKHCGAYTRGKYNLNSKKEKRKK